MTAAASADAMPAMPSRTRPTVTPLVKDDTYVAESLDPSVIVYVRVWGGLKARMKRETLVNDPFLRCGWALVQVLTAWKLFIASPPVLPGTRVIITGSPKPVYECGVLGSWHWTLRCACIPRCPNCIPRHGRDIDLHTEFRVRS